MRRLLPLVLLLLLPLPVSAQTQSVDALRQRVARLRAQRPMPVPEGTLHSIEYMLDVSNRTELAGLTGRWRIPTESDRTLPPTIHVVLRNPSKSIATDCPEEVA